MKAITFHICDLKKDTQSIDAHKKFLNECDVIAIKVRCFYQGTFYAAMEIVAQTHKHTYTYAP